MRKLRRQNEDAVNSRKVEVRIGKDRGSWMMGSRNVDECWRRSKSVSRKVEKVVKLNEGCGRWNTTEE
jgi:hypothetical protein